MGPDVPKVIKLVAKSDLVALSEKARALHLGVGRRADWLTEYVAESSNGALWAILQESHPQRCYRCQIVIRRSGDGIENFLLDVLPDDFEQLPNLPEERLVQLTRWALSHVPVSPLPAEYLAEWDRAAPGCATVEKSKSR
ncbi:hypothetical protein [Planosporangium thailandense]|uniref:hypothetical protein n=1 Tax=Planosporangium thailandense TaxID=765197 RepID=UPI00197C7B83|nr:hypothetical protein [Planosporangium thailandense]